MLDNEIEISVPKEVGKPIGPGLRLRKIREARHLTLDEIVKRIRLSRERLIQLENDDYLLMGAPAFAKGYLRAYASQLGMAKEEILTILQAFDELNLGVNIQHSKPELINEKIDQVAPKTTRWLNFLLFVVVLLGISGYLWHNHAKALNAGVNTEKSTTEPAVEVPVSLPPDAVNTQNPVQVQTSTQAPTAIPNKTDLPATSGRPALIDIKSNTSDNSPSPKVIIGSSGRALRVEPMQLAE